MVTEVGKESDILGGGGSEDVLKAETMADKGDDLNDHQGLCVIDFYNKTVDRSAPDWAGEGAQARVGYKANHRFHRKLYSRIIQAAIGQPRTT